MSASDTRELASSRPIRPKWLLLWTQWTTAALLLLIIATPVMATEKDRHVQLVSTAWSPFTNPPGHPRFALDLVEEALERLGITADTVIVDESRLTPSLLSGEFDGSAALWKDSEREHVLIYSQPYLENRLVLVGRTGSDVSATALVELAGKRIALVGGYAYGEEVEMTSGLIIVDSQSLEDSVAKVLSGEVDYTLIDELVVQHLVSNYPDEARTRLAFGATALLKRSLHLALQRSLPDVESIISRFNTELRFLMADRSYHRLLHLDWIHADVDGDGLVEFVPHDDRIGPRPPEHSYELFATSAPLAGLRTTERFYLGGDIYEGWSAVPDRYTTSLFERPAPQLKLFSFSFSF